MSTVPGLEGASARFAEPPQDISSVEGDQTVLASESQEVAREERQKSPASDAYADADVDADADADGDTRRTATEARERARMYCGEPFTVYSTRTATHRVSIGAKIS